MIYYIKNGEVTMIKIAICEDEPVYTENIKEIIKKNIEAEITCFDSGETLINALDNSFKADIYVMDIELTGISGLDTSRKIRQLDKYAVIIFITNHTRYVFEAFEVNAFRFIPKEEIADTFAEVLKEAVHKIEDTRLNSFYAITCENGNPLMIDLNEVISIEKNGKYAEFYLTDNRMYKVRCSITEVMSHIKKSCFISINRSTVINAEHIERFSCCDIYMSDNTRQQVSKRQLSRIKELVMSYWG